MTINRETTPVKPSQVSVVTCLLGGERLLATRFIGNSPKTVVIPASLITPALSIGGVLQPSNNLSELTNTSVARDNLGLGDLAIYDSVTTLQLTPTSVSAGVYGDGNNIPKITVDLDGRIVDATVVPIALSSALVKVSVSGGSYTATSIGDSFKIHGGLLLDTSITGKTITVFHQPSGVVAGTYGTSTIIPQVIVDGQGHVTSIALVTIPGGFAGVNVSAGASAFTGTSWAYRGQNGIDVSVSVSSIEIFLTSSGASAGTYGTSSIIPQLTIDGFGRITNVQPVTISAQNAITKVSCSTSSFSATSNTDTLNIRGGGATQIDITTGIMTVSTRAANEITVSCSTSALVSGPLSIRLTDGVHGDLVGGILTIGITSALAAGVTTVGTSSIIPRITTDGLGRITGIVPTTLAPFFAFVSTSTSTLSATGLTGDTLNIRGAGIVDIGIVGGIITVSAPAGNDVKVSCSTSAIVSGTLNVRLTDGIHGDIVGGIFTIGLTSVLAANTTTVGTSSVIPQITVDGMGRITGIVPVTISAQNGITKVSCSTSSFTAGVNDTLNIRGGGATQIDITAGIMTVSTAAAIITVSASSSTFSGSTLNVRGGGSASVDIVGGALIVSVAAAGAGGVAVSCSTSSITTGTLNFRTNDGIKGDLVAGVLTIGLTSVLAANTTTIGTSMIGHSITVDGMGRITAISPVTLTPFFAKVSCSTSSYTAVSAASGDTLNIRGGGATQIDITTGIMTVSTPAAIITVSCSSSTFSGATLNIRGGGVVSADIVAGILTVSVAAGSGITVSCSTSNIATGTLNFRTNDGIKGDLVGGVLTIGLTSVLAANTTTIGTSMIGHAITVDGMGRITAISPVTLTPFFAKVSVSSSVYSAVSAAQGDTLNIRGGGALSADVIGGIITLSVAPLNGRVLLATVSVSATTKLLLPNVFSSTYKHYELEMYDVYPASAGVGSIVCAFGAGSSVNTSLFYQQYTIYQGGSQIIVQAGSIAAMLIPFAGAVGVFSPAAAATSIVSFGDFQIFNPNGVGSKGVIGNFVFSSIATAVKHTSGQVFNSMFSTGATFTDLQIHTDTSASAGAIFNGTNGGVIKLYGVL